LAAGINSSKLLQLSGIGSVASLKNADIKPVFINEERGKNLQNHPLLSISMLADPREMGRPREQLMPIPSIMFTCRP